MLPAGPILLVAGARPNFMKIAPIQAELDRRGLASLLVHTGQHYDDDMSDVFFGELGIRVPDEHLRVGSGSHGVQTGRVMSALDPVVERVGPTWVVVVGDVNSTMAAALVGAKAGVPVAHVEAGLRSGDWSMPEEVNRVVTDRVSDLLLAPSEDAVATLLAEGRDARTVRLVGNVMVDSLVANRERAVARAPEQRFGLSAGAYALLTLHRPSNVDDREGFARLLEAVAVIAEDLPVLYPAHPRARAALDAATLPPNVIVTGPVGYLDSIGLQAGARLVLTDSGGMQEETTVLGVPCLTLRETTERPITISEGTNRLVGVDPDAITAAAREVLAHPPPARRPALWDGRAAERIVDALVAGPVRPRRP
ncbi:MAG: UDP-N-acetylglucosamine 2-epimerase [Actinomycetia bacterium]|nr:UDP-N-acetylglucosamine 2-epimerase [Actinomycetes bacterium]